MTRTEAQDRFDWHGMTGKSKKKTASDVSINLHKGEHIGITFRNGADKKIGERLEVAVYKNRVLFRDSPNGVIMQNKSGKIGKNVYARINDITEELRPFIGDYELKYDDFYELYYVEKGE